MTNKLILSPTPLPATNDKLQLRRPPSLKQTALNVLSNGAWESASPYMGSVDAKTSIHGSVAMDRAATALALQNYGKKQGIEHLAKASWAEIDKAVTWATKQMFIDGQPIDRKSRKKAATEQLTLQLGGTSAEQ